MFTGIVEEVGTVKHIKKGQHSAVMEIQAKKILEDARIGDSIAVNGICLTVTTRSDNAFTVDVMHETLNRSAFSGLTSKSLVNLERAMPANGRFGGHMVAGHIDGTGRIFRIKRDDNAVWYTIQTDIKIMHFVVEKGSIAIDGISLTVACIQGDRFSVSTIPHTVNNTILSQKKEGDLVNLETDLVGKYIEKYVEKRMSVSQKQDSNLTKEFLEKYGFY